LDASRDDSNYPPRGDTLEVASQHRFEATAKHFIWKSVQYSMMI